MKIDNYIKYWAYLCESEDGQNLTKEHIDDFGGLSKSSNEEKISRKIGDLFLEIAAINDCGDFSYIGDDEYWGAEGRVSVTLDGVPFQKLDEEAREFVKIELFPGYQYDSEDVKNDQEKSRLLQDFAKQFKNKWKIIKNPYRDHKLDHKRRSSNETSPHFIVVEPGVYSASMNTSMGELNLELNIKKAKLGYSFDFDEIDLLNADYGILDKLPTRRKLRKPDLPNE